MQREGFAPLAIIIAAFAILLLAGGFLYYVQDQRDPGMIACTMEAKQCPDGKSYVGRTGPHCEFAACPQPAPVPVPTPKPQPDMNCSGSGDSCPSGYTCIQKCGPPVARVDDPPPGYYCERSDIAKKPRMCPICLASNTQIATPEGYVNVKTIKVGSRVWSVDQNGNKVISTVSEVSRTKVPASHQVIHLTLSDQREVYVSPLHPTTNGLRVQDLRAGALYDGSIVQSAEPMPYWDDATYDIKPDSATGYYWANGILLGSTLK